MRLRSHPTSSTSSSTPVEDALTLVAGISPANMNFRAYQSPNQPEHPPPQGKHRICPRCCAEFNGPASSHVCVLPPCREGVNCWTCQPNIYFYWQHFKKVHNPEYQELEAEKKATKKNAQKNAEAAEKAESAKRKALAQKEKLEKALAKKQKKDKTRTQSLEAVRVSSSPFCRP